MTNSPCPGTAVTVVAGVDTHADTHHVAVLDAVTGAVLGDLQVPADSSGYRLAERFVASFGTITRWGIEGTSSYGAGLSAHLRAGGHVVFEVNRPVKSMRRAGKSDPLDALGAARVVLADTGGQLPAPKNSDGATASIRVLLIARRSAVKARAVAQQQIRDLLITAPARLRERLQSLKIQPLITHLATTRPGSDPAIGVETTTGIALRSLARRHRDLSVEITDLETMIDTLVTDAAPALRATHGVGPIIAAQLLITAGDNPDRLRSKASFAALIGVSPIPASSGKHTRHRLNRGGDRQANSAVHQIAITRIRYDPRTRAYIEKKTSEGKTKKEAMRALKRHLANEIHSVLTNPQPIPDISDLRPLRLAKGLSQKQAAEHLGWWPTDVSTLERGKRRNDTHAQTYRDWLNAQPNAA